MIRASLDFGNELSGQLADGREACFDTASAPIPADKDARLFAGFWGRRPFINEADDLFAGPCHGR